MAFISVQTQGSVFIVTFGEYAAAQTVNSKKRTFQKAGIGFNLAPDASTITVDMTGFPSWRVIKEASTDYPDALVIDTVNGVAPTNNDHLFDLLVTALTTT
jgi:hypothetical protein